MPLVQNLLMEGKSADFGVNTMVCFDPRSNSSKRFRRSAVGVFERQLPTQSGPSPSRSNFIHSGHSQIVTPYI